VSLDGLRSIFMANIDDGVSLADFRNGGQFRAHNLRSVTIIRPHLKISEYAKFVSGTPNVTTLCLHDTEWLDHYKVVDQLEVDLGHPALRHLELGKFKITTNPPRPETDFLIFGSLIGATRDLRTVDICLKLVGGDYPSAFGVPGGCFPKSFGINPIPSVKSLTVFMRTADAASTDRYEVELSKMLDLFPSVTTLCFRSPYAAPNSNTTATPSDLNGSERILQICQAKFPRLDVFRLDKVVFDLSMLLALAGHYGTIRVNEGRIKCPRDKFALRLKEAMIFKEKVAGALENPEMKSSVVLVPSDEFRRLAETDIAGCAVILE
jgi:hypothetical protein